MRILYTLLYIHLLPLFVVRLFWRSRRAPAYRKRLRERFGIVPRRSSDAPLVWVHAVSVGEAIAATPMVRRLMALYPEHEFCITTTTPTGSDRVQAAFADEVLHYYLPYDLPSLYTLFLKSIRPDVLVIMETELWPNLIATCDDRHIPVIVANARMSSQSARGYKRWHKLAEPMLQAVDLVAAQTRQDQERFVFLGASRERVVETGSIKYDIYLDDQTLKRRDELTHQLGLQGRKVVVFASTHPGEDEVIIPMIKRLAYVDEAFLGFVVPRHPERFPVVEQLANAHKLGLVRLSSGDAASASTTMVLGDTMGEMMAIYGLADVVFVGGSLVPHGGHNVLEPAAWSLPVFTGPYTHNFRAITRNLLRHKGLLQVHDALDLERLVQNWLKGAISLDEYGKHANQVLVENRGTLERLLQHIQRVIDNTPGS